MARIQKRPRSKNDLKAFNFIKILEVIIDNLVTYETVRPAIFRIRNLNKHDSSTPSNALVVFNSDIYRGKNRCFW